ncbi:hypothetical protein FOL47_007023 [Perkinsus chesapeaki]|uniref:ENTH domain-containing protein n=1 Tax=Perkinsus chesapeaki TaxID=330153 RepID=A0A7J6LP56_PERCH|nr:hypothetical protein FOL47_007023 [Perkinsus chesapeaki]
MSTVWSAIGDKKEKWRRIYKGLNLLDYLLKFGSERVVDETRDGLHRIRALQDFQYSEEGRDKGAGIREKSREIVDLVNNPAQLRAERDKARQGRDKYIGIGSAGQTVTTAIGAPPPGTGYDGSYNDAQYAPRDGSTNPTVLNATVVSGPRHLPEKSKLEELRKQDQERQRQRAMADDEAARRRRQQEEQRRREQQQRQQAAAAVEESESSSSESESSSSESEDETPVARQRPVVRRPPPPPPQRRPTPQQPQQQQQQSVDLLNMNAWGQQQQPVAYQSAAPQMPVGGYQGQQGYPYPPAYYPQQQAMAYNQQQPMMGGIPPQQAYQQPAPPAATANPFTAGYQQQQPQSNNPFSGGGLQQFRGL